MTSGWKAAPDHTPAHLADERKAQGPVGRCGTEPAWALLHERSAFLAQRCAEATGADGVPEAVHQAHQRAAAIAAAIAAHVPTGLLPSGVALAAGARK
jgi:hypothetical protein